MILGISLIVIGVLLATLGIFKIRGVCYACKFNFWLASKVRSLGFERWANWLESVNHND